jgi:hypothetical protein
MGDILLMTIDHSGKSMRHLSLTLVLGLILPFFLLFCFHIPNTNCTWYPIVPWLVAANGSELYSLSALLLRFFLGDGFGITGGGFATPPALFMIGVALLLPGQPPQMAFDE